MERYEDLPKEWQAECLACGDCCKHKYEALLANKLSSCPHIVSSGEGTSYCDLAESSVMTRDMTIATLTAHFATIECTRSHPHENMSPICELKTELAQANNQLSHKQAALTAAEARIKELESEKYR